MPSSFQKITQKLGFKHKTLYLFYSREAIPFALKIPLEFLPEHLRSIGNESDLGMY